MSLASTPPDRRFLESGCRIVTLVDRPAWGWHTLRCLGQLTRELRRLRPDIVHVHGARPILVGTLAARAAGITNVVCALHGAHDLMAVRGDGSTTRFGRWIARVVHGTGFALCARILVCARRLEQDARVSLSAVGVPGARTMRRKGRILYHGVEARALADAARRAGRRVRAPDSAALVVGTLSRLDEPKKGVAVLLEAVSRLERAGTPVSLRIAGDGHSRGPLERRAAELGLRDCRFLGFVTDVGEFYRSLDVFVLASFSEGMPLVNLEAMASGTVVITTDVGGAAEAVQHERSGLVVPPRDVEALAAAIRRLAADPALAATLAAGGQSRALEHFDVDVMFDKLASVYEELVPAPEVLFA